MLHARTRRFAVRLAALAFASLATATMHAQATLTIGLAKGVDPNGEPQYTATVTNTSGVTANSVSVTYTMPSGELPISPPPSGGCLFTPGVPHLTVLCSIPSLGAGLSHNFAVAVHPVDTAPQDVTAVADADNADPVSAFTTSTITEVGLAEMQVAMNSTNPGKVGEPLVYTVTVTNIQDDTAHNVFALLALPKFTTFVSATKGCTHGILVACKLGAMNPGTSKTVTITVLPTVSGWTQATAGVRFTTPDRAFTNNGAANSVWVNP